MPHSRQNALGWAFLTKYMMDRRVNRTKGFGLIELMITLVIAALLLSIAVPAYDRFVDRAKVAKGGVLTPAAQLEAAEQVKWTTENTPFTAFSSRLRFKMVYSRSYTTRRLLGRPTK